MNTQTLLDKFFDRQDQDAFARSLGWEDAAQMIYYQDMAIQAEAQDAQQLPPPPDVIQIHELDKVDSREVYEDMTGVY